MSSHLRGRGLDETYVKRARAPGSPRDFAVLFASTELQPALTALFALQAEVLAAARASADHAVAHTRVEWWRGEFQRLSEGNPVHPVSRALARETARARIDLAPLSELLAAAEWELARLTLETPDELETACWRSQGLVQWIGMQLAGVASPQASAFARELGYALGIERALLTLALDARRGVILLPLVELNARGIALEDLQGERPSASLAEYAASLCIAARTRLKASRLSLPGPLSSALRAHIVLAALCDLQLARIERSARRLEPLHREISTLQRLWTAWRAARRTASGTTS